MKNFNSEKSLENTMIIKGVIKIWLFIGRIYIVPVLYPYIVKFWNSIIIGLRNSQKWKEMIIMSENQNNIIE